MEFPWWWSKAKRAEQEARLRRLEGLLGQTHRLLGEAEDRLDEIERVVARLRVSHLERMKKEAQGGH